MLKDHTEVSSRQVR